MPDPTGRAAFHTTRWSVVLGARRGADAQASRSALETLIGAYWRPIYGAFRRRGLEREDAADACQEFFARLLERDDLAHVDPARGRFRSWLFAAVEHFLTGEWRRAGAQKRGGGRAPRSLDAALLERGLVPEDGETPERAFARDFARALLERTLARLAADYDAAGRGELFEALRAGLADAGVGPTQETQAEIGARLGLSDGAVKVAAYRLRRRYAELLRAEIAETLPAPADSEAVEDEIRGLFEALG